MAINQTSMRDGDDGANRARVGAYRDWLSTAFSAVAICLSCISFYMSALQGPALEVYVPPTIHYGRDGGGDTELFAIPITITNNGARSGAVLSIELEVQNLKTNTTKRYYSAFLGEHPREAHKSEPPVRTVEHSGPGGLFRNGALLSCGRGAAEARRRAGRVRLPPAAQHGHAAGTISVRSPARPHAARAHGVPDDPALDVRSASRFPARHHRHARQGLEAGYHRRSLTLGPATCRDRMALPKGQRANACGFQISTTQHTARSAARAPACPI